MKTAEKVGESEEQLGGSAMWEGSTEKREARLRERKAYQMILAVRSVRFFSSPLSLSPF